MSVTKTRSGSKASVEKQLISRDSKKEGKITKDKENLIKCVTSQENLEEILFLLDIVDNFTFTYEGKTLLGQSVFSKSSFIIDLLLEKGIDINIKDNFGKTPFYIAVENKLFETALYLLARGADPFIVDEKGISPYVFSLADYEFFCVLVKIAIMKNIDVFNIKDPLGNTLLHYASLNINNTKIMEFLIKGKINNRILKKFLKKNTIETKPINVNAVNDMGDTALHWAVRVTNNSKNIDLLLEYVKTDIRNNKNLTAVEEAAVNKKAGNAYKIYQVMKKRKEEDLLNERMREMILSAVAFSGV